MKGLKLCQLKNIKNMRFKPLQALNLYIQIPLVRHSSKTRMNITKIRKNLTIYQPPAPTLGGKVFLDIS